MTIVKGQKSIGFSNRPYEPESPSTLPPASGDPDAVIQELVERVSNMETLVEGKADADSIRTLIAYSDEAVLIKAQDIVLAGDVTIAKVVNEQNGTTAGEVPESITRIIGDRVQTGVITSNNWGATEGSAYDLNNGTITIGGSDSPALQFDGTDLFVAGTITASSFIEESATIDPDGRSVGDVVTQLDNKLTEAALSAGVDAILAAAGDEFNLDVRNAQIIAAHKDADITGLGSGYSGTLRTGLAVTANGVAAGYNRKSDGAWVDSFAINGTTGDATFAGTVAADSVIANTVTVDGTEVVTVRDNADTGATHAGSSGNPHNTSLAQVGGDLDDIADGSTYFKSTATQNTGGTRAANALDSDFEYIRALSTQKIAVSGTNPTNGLIIDSSGMRGYSGGSQQFNIPTDGSTVAFSGDLDTQGFVVARGGNSAGGQTAALHALPSSDNVLGVYGEATGSSGVGVVGFSSQFDGVQGNTDTGTGGSFSADGTGGTALDATASNNAEVGLDVTGRSVFDIGVIGITNAIEVISGDVDFSSSAVTIGSVSGDLEVTNGLIAGSATASAGRPALYLNEESAPGGQTGQMAMYGVAVSAETSLGIVSERSVLTTASTPDRALRVNINGTEYDLMLATT